MNTSQTSDGALLPPTPDLGRICGRCGGPEAQCTCPVKCPEPFVRGDGMRFHWRLHNPGGGECYQVYSTGLEHWANCDTAERAKSVAQALELLYANDQGPLRAQPNKTMPNHQSECVCVQCENAKAATDCSRLRRTLSNTLLALGNGSACSQEASIEFMELIPQEVESVRKQWELNHDRELKNARKAEADLDQATRQTKILEAIIADAAQLLADIMRDEVNHQDEAEKWLRAYAPQHLFPKEEPKEGPPPQDPNHPNYIPVRP